MKRSHRFRPLWAALTVLTAAAAVQGQPSLADFGFKNMEATGARPLLVIVIEDPLEKPAAHNNQYYDKLFFGPDVPFVSGYFAAMSGNRLKYSRAGVVGPYKVQVKIPQGGYRDSGAFHADGIREAAKAGFDFSKFDKNRDGVVTANELTVVVIDTGGPTGGQTDNGVDVNIPAQKVSVRQRIAGFGHQASLMTFCHEMTHALGALDLYGDLTRNVRLTTMGPTIIDAPDVREKYYLDPWHRMQLGWVQPQVRDLRIAGSITLTVPQVVEKTGAAPDPLILFDFSRGAREFFILEYRNKTVGPKNHYDADVASNGLAIWHVQQGSDKKPVKVPTDSDPKINLYGVYNRGAPNWAQGGNQLYTQKDGEIVLRWNDRSDTGVRAKATTPLLGASRTEKLSVNWTGPRRTGASIIQSSFGNLEVVAQEGNELVHYFFAPGKAWVRTAFITNKATGPGAICQNKNSNFEVVALEGKDLVHYWGVPGKGWNRGGVITNKATGPASILFSSVGNLEVVAIEGKELVHYWTDKGKWRRGSVISNKVAEPGSIAQNRNGNFEVVALEGKELVHYYTAPGKPYNRGAVITRNATGPGSIVQGVSGNLEVIVLEGKELVHYWFDKTWRRGGVISSKADRMGVGALGRNRNNNLEAVTIEGNQIVHYWEVPGKAWSRGASY